MNGSLSQVIAIATHGSAWLRDRSSVDLDDFAARHRAFLGVGELTFEGTRGVRPWLEAQADDGVERLWLRSTEFEGGRPAFLLVRESPLGLLTAGAQGSRLWLADWTVGDRAAPDRRIWKVAYNGSTTEDEPRRPEVGQAARKLVAAANAARRFTQDHRPQIQTDLFAEALRQWAEPGSVPNTPLGLFPSGQYGQEALRLASMAEQVAHLFGGMGDWDDEGFGDPATAEAFEAVSRRLFLAMVEAFIASVNSELIAG